MLTYIVVFDKGVVMKTDKNILIAFILNMSFSIFEFIGGTITNSVAIISDAIHDLGDSLSIGISYFLEKKSKKKPDDKYTYGYLRYSVIGSTITTMILLTGSCIVIYNSFLRFKNPETINYNGMIIFAIIGVITNIVAAYKTKKGHSLNQKAVNLHMLEDVLGWIVVLIGALVMKVTNIAILDPILSILVSTYIFINAIKNFKQIIDLFLEKTPSNINVSELKKHLLEINNVEDIHHIHIWSIDGYNNYATMHVVVNKFDNKTKHKVKDELKEHGIAHVTVELETKEEKCQDNTCTTNHINTSNHHHHH